MNWTPELIQYYIENYYALRSYELNPFEQLRTFNGILVLTGSKVSLAPYAETCDLNWEFDRALKKLGDSSTSLTKNKEVLFREIYLNGKGELQPDLFKEFCQILFDNGY